MEFNATFLATIISFLVFVFLMNKILYEPMGRIVAERKTFIDENDYEMADETITKTKRIVVDDLDVDDAIMQMELGDHDFFLFRDKDTKLISVIYTRKDGSYGVIEVV